ncbi:3-isopropylmalate dehydratase small subunit [Sphingobium sp. LB126]|uniref:3-isopropylmalate dehydratase small subunit n=1 Tax=Sphingobium sp. LB126 TaxID=1983755 RepID=UPI000C20C3D1|nr:3-isopropylmalate dehydratase small subunit [Sphingobium sp. LB126]PJG46668.1 3-isopropylmalate dehydratase small subunit [Sphingobium sp. LB126]
MKPFTTLTAIAAPLIRDNIDTDAIIPSREMKSTGKTGLAEGLFAPWRYLTPGGRDPDPQFILNQPAYAQAEILLGGRNFGCGSSREHAVWALAEYGIRAVIAPSFAPIFAGNCTRNGIVPVVLDDDAIAAIGHDGGLVTIDLAAQTVALQDGLHWSFEIGAEAKAMLFEGLDPIDLTLKSRADIAAFQTADKVARPWIYLGDLMP